MRTLGIEVGQHVARRGLVPSLSRQYHSPKSPPRSFIGWFSYLFNSIASKENRMKFRPRRPTAYRLRFTFAIAAKKLTVGGCLPILLANHELPL